MLFTKVVGRITFPTESDGKGCSFFAAAYFALRVT